MFGHPCGKHTSEDTVVECKSFEKEALTGLLLNHIQIKTVQSLIPPAHNKTPEQPLFFTHAAMSNESIWLPL